MLFHGLSLSLSPSPSLPSLPPSTTGKRLHAVPRALVAVEDFKKQIQLLHVQDAEEYNNVKLKLELNATILEQLLQQMKATCQLNQEKFQYNFQVRDVFIDIGVCNVIRI